MNKINCTITINIGGVKRKIENAVMTTISDSLEQRKRKPRRSTRQQPQKN